MIHGFCCVSEQVSDDLSFASVEIDKNYWLTLPRWRKFVSQVVTWPAATRVFLPTTKGGREERPWERGWLKHSRDFWLSLEGCQTFLGYWWFIFYRNRTRLLCKRTVSYGITIWSLATIWTTAMYIYFFHFEVRVFSEYCGVAIFARIRIDNLPVHLGYNGTSNSSRVNLQLLKSYEDVNGHEESVSWP